MALDRFRAAVGEDDVSKAGRRYREQLRSQLALRGRIDVITRFGTGLPSPRLSSACHYRLRIVAKRERRRTARCSRHTSSSASNR